MSRAFGLPSGFSLLKLSACLVSAKEPVLEGLTYSVMSAGFWIFSCLLSWLRASGPSRVYLNSPLEYPATALVPERFSWAFTLDMLTTLFGILVARESWFRMLWIERLGDLEFEFESRAEPFWLSCLAFSGSEAVPWGLVLLLFWSLWSSQLVSRFTSLSFYASDATRALVCEQRWSKLLISPHKLVDSFCCFGLFEFTVGLGAFLSIHYAWPLA